MENDIAEVNEGQDPFRIMFTNVFGIWDNCDHSVVNRSPNVVNPGAAMDHVESMWIQTVPKSKAFRNDSRRSCGGSGFEMTLLGLLRPY